MIDMRIDPRNMKLLEDALKAADSKTGDTAERSAAKAMWYIGRSGAKAVRPKSTASKREIVPFAETGSMTLDMFRSGTRKNDKKWAIKRLRQDKPAVFIPTNNKNDKRRVIGNLGLAANLFRIAAARFGNAISGKSVKGASRFVKTIRRKSGRSFTMLMELLVSYIEKAFPGAADTAIHKGLTSFIHTFDQDWASAIKAGGW